MSCCCCWLSHTLWQKWHLRKVPAEENNVAQRCLPNSCLLFMRKRRCSVASFCQKSAFPCYVWAVEMSSGHTALILPLCVTQNVSSDSLTQLMFHGGTVISTFAAQLEDCQLQLFFSPILPLHLNFFFFGWANQHLRVVWLQKQSNVSDGTR